MHVYNHTHTHIHAQHKTKHLYSGTILEVIYQRWGMPTFLIFAPACIFSTLLDTLVNITACAETISALSGVSTYTFTLILPIIIMYFNSRGTCKSNTCDACKVLPAQVHFCIHINTCGSVQSGVDTSSFLRCCVHERRTNE